MGNPFDVSSTTANKYAKIADGYLNLEQKFNAELTTFKSSSIFNEMMKSDVTASAKKAERISMLTSLISSVPSLAITISSLVSAINSGKKVSGDVDSNISQVKSEETQKRSEIQSYEKAIGDSNKKISSFSQIISDKESEVNAQGKIVDKVAGTPSGDLQASLDNRTDGALKGLDSALGTAKGDLANAKNLPDTIEKMVDGKVVKVDNTEKKQKIKNIEQKISELNKKIEERENKLKSDIEKIVNDAKLAKAKASDELEQAKSDMAAEKNTLNDNTIKLNNAKRELQQIVSARETLENQNKEK